MKTYNLDTLKASHEGKKQYATMTLAAEAARRMSENQPMEYGAYKCEWCDSYHIGRTHKKTYRRRY